MSAANCCKPKRTMSIWGSLPLALVLLTLFAAIASAASYVRTTLKELTTRSVAIAEVEVIDKKYPALEPNQNFPRTHVELKLLKALKGDLPEKFVIDTPGGINGDVVSYVPDGPDFKLGERAIVFIKEPAKGHFMVQDLGLGKFNVVSRDNKHFVESPVCSKAFPGAIENQKDLEANLLTRSIPYPMFCDMVSTYVAGKEPAKDPAALAAMLAASGSHKDSAVPSVVAEISEAQHTAHLRQSVLYSGFVLTLFAVIAALVVRRRRQMKAAPVSSRHIPMILGGALVAGAALGGISSNAFVRFEQNTLWNLDKPLTGKVADNKIIWRQSTSASKTNANSFANLQVAFDKWQAVNFSRLAFTAGGSTDLATNSSGDGQNVMAWTETPSNDFSASTLAITFSSFTVGTSSNFQDGDIIFNDRDFNWAPGNNGNVLSVSLHEIGHFIGLNHTTDKTAIMFPFDGGFSNLSADEITAAQSIYPGPDEGTGATPPPAGPEAVPIAVAGASPTTGLPPLDVSFSGLNSTPGPLASPIVSYEWNFGDSTTATGAEVTHTYTSVGTFTASLKVTDQNGLFGIAMVEINVGKNAQVSKGSFKLSFKSLGKDSFSVTLFSDKLIGIKSAIPTTGEAVRGSVLIGDQEWLFDFDVLKAKSVNKQGPKIKVNSTSGIASVSIKSADLRDVLGGHGAVDDNILGETVEVPVTLWFGEGSNIYVFGDIPFFYKASAGKSGSGKF